jgi:hypothetical protein
MDILAEPSWHELHNAAVQPMNKEGEGRPQACRRMCWRGAESPRKKEVPCSHPVIGNALTAVAPVSACRGVTKGVYKYLLRVFIFCRIPCGLKGVTLLLAAARSLAKALASHSICSTETLISCLGHGAYPLGCYKSSRIREPQRQITGKRHACACTGRCLLRCKEDTSFVQGVPMSPGAMSAVAGGVAATSLSSSGCPLMMASSFSAAAARFSVTSPSCPPHGRFLAHMHAPVQGLRPYCVPLRKSGMLRLMLEQP